MYIHGRGGQRSLTMYADGGGHQKEGFPREYPNGLIGWFRSHGSSRYISGISLDNGRAAGALADWLISSYLHNKYLDMWIPFFAHFLCLCFLSVGSVYEILSVCVRVRCASGACACACICCVALFSYALAKCTEGKKKKATQDIRTCACFNVWLDAR
jgi:hypothetical protein